MPPFCYTPSMKKRYFLLIPIIVALALASRYRRRHQEVQPEPQSTLATTCYERSVEGTSDAPYTVHETIQLTMNDTAVSGIKAGTQSGPDMSNGYEGTLDGSKTGNALDLIFSYVIEGSAQKEKEHYVIRNNDLVKYRYVLKEENGMLVPDTASSYTEQIYKQVSCIS